MITVNLFDRAFSHLICSVHGKKAKNIKYVRNIPNYDGITVFTDDMMYLINPDSIKSKYKIGWLIEPESISPQNYRNIINILDKFDFFLTHSPRFVKKMPSKFKFVPFGGCWIKEENYHLNHKKNQDVSMIYSEKRSTVGHALRHEIANKIKNIDLFGSPVNKRIEYKEEGLTSYKYSIVVENESTPDFFTEKLLDCFAVGTIPIYWGCPNIHTYFDKKSILQFQTVEELSNIVDNLKDLDYNNLKESIDLNHTLSKKYEITDDWIAENIYKGLSL